MESTTLTEVTNIERQSETVENFSAKKSGTKFQSTTKSTPKGFTEETIEMRVTRSTTKTPAREVGRSRTPLKEQVSFRKEQVRPDTTPTRKQSTKKSTTKTPVIKHSTSKTSTLKESITETTEEKIQIETTTPIQIETTTAQITVTVPVQSTVEELTTTIPTETITTTETTTIPTETTVTSN